MSRILAEPVVAYGLEPVGRTGVTADGDWLHERLLYSVRPRPKSKFKTVLDAREIFAARGASHSTVVTRVNPGATSGNEVLKVELCHELGVGRIEERLHCVLLDGPARKMQAGAFSRQLQDRDGQVIRREEANLAVGVGRQPSSIYPEVFIPFLLRGPPLRKKHALYAWTSDRFIARVYYETRSHRRLTVAAGTFPCHEVWMYPDLNDWIALGGMLTRLAKPLLPRYTIWYETPPPHRVVRFEGAYGPPGAPEVILELATDNSSRSGANALT